MTFTLNAFDVALAGDTLQQQCHGAAHAAGWWGFGELDLVEVVRSGADTPATKLLAGALVAQKLMLSVSELAEAMEGHRKGLKDDKLPHRDMLEVELADTVIRVFDLAGAMGYDLGGAIAEKMAFNAQRPDHKPEARAAAGGKSY
jgi:NTP pyrophosphatase (non-canonical NTP hydrolase)